MVAVEILGLTGAVGAVPAVTPLLLADPSPAVRLRAALALGRLGLPTALEPLLAASVPGTAPGLRAAAAQALGDLGDPRAVGRLGELLAESDHAVASAAARSLLRLGPAGRQMLQQVRQHEAGSAGRHAAGVLARAAVLARASALSRAS